MEVLGTVTKLARFFLELPCYLGKMQQVFCNFFRKVCILILCFLNNETDYEIRFKSFLKIPGND